MALERRALSAHAQDWLDKFDVHRDEIERGLRKVHNGETALWMRRWR